MFENLRRDLARGGASRGERVRELFFNTGAWAVVSYRFRRSVYRLRGPRLLLMVPNAVALVVKLIGEILTNIEIPPTVEIGPGLYIAHTGYIVLNSRVTLGANCTLTPGVVLGHGRGGKSAKSGCPQVGDRVYFGPGAIVVGPLTIGHDALIAPGAVVTHSVPPRGVMAGNPARLISSAGSFELIEYPDMDKDIDRLKSLAEA